MCSEKVEGEACSAEPHQPSRTGHPVSHLISSWQGQITNCAAYPLTKVTWEEGASVEDLLPSDRLVGISVRHFLNCEFMEEGLSHSKWGHPWAGDPGRYKKGS